MTEKIAIIGGTGVDTFASWRFKNRASLLTKFGAPSAEIETYQCGDREFYFLARHGRPHCIAPHQINYRANLRALFELGVRKIIAINSVGGIAEQAAPGRVIIPDQIIDYTYGREQTFFDVGANCAVQHIDFTEPYSETLRVDLLNAAARIHVPIVNGGVYAATQGPRLETAAEIKRLERDGCDIVGMTGMPEAALARELNIEYASLCIVVNAAAGKNIEPLTLAAMQAAMSAALIDIEKIIQAMIAID